MSEKSSKKYWFPAKRYGWGWGIPRTWQGWLVMVGFGLLEYVGILLFRFQNQPLAFGGYTIGIIFLLVVVCYWKGEPPHWRWGGKRP